MKDAGRSRGGDVGAEEGQGDGEGNGRHASEVLLPNWLYPFQNDARLITPFVTKLAVQ